MNHETNWPALDYYWGDMAKDVFCDLHYGRYTYYPLHDRPRYERNSVQQELTPCLTSFYGGRVSSIMTVGSNIYSTSPC